MSLALRLIVWLPIAAFTAAAWPASRPQPFGQLDTSDLIVQKNLRYEGDGDSIPEILLDVYRPHPSPQPPGTPRPRRPAVLAVHSGSWIGGSRTDYRFFPRDTPIRLARAGMVVVVPDYPLAKATYQSFDYEVTCLRVAVRWIRDNAEEFDVDPDRIIIFGQSAGARLAACAAVAVPDDDATAQQSSRAQAVIAFYGAYDLPALLTERHLTHDPVRTLLGGRPDVPDSVLYHASPINHVTPQYPPTLLIHGTEDAWIPPAQSQRMDDALARANVLHKLILIPGARHGFEATVNDPPPRDLLPDIFAFLERVWNTPLKNSETPAR